MFFMSSSGRFLTDPEQRALLFEAASGYCQACGDELDEGWHADHITPYSITGRTNVFEMQALCVSCNTKKGDRLIAGIETRTMRPGQISAVTTIFDRIRMGESHTAVVLPTRYGKSDVIRVAGAMLKEAGLISRSLIMVPNQMLRSQFVFGPKFEEAAERYNLPADKISTYETTQRPSLPFPRENAYYLCCHYKSNGSTKCRNAGFLD